MAEIKNLLIELEIAKHNNKMLSIKISELQTLIDKLKKENEMLLSKDDSLNF